MKMSTEFCRILGAHIFSKFYIKFTVSFISISLKNRAISIIPTLNAAILR